ncbi:MAG: type II toxin-antitoxin system VapC family toxin [Chloroflexota bacterium]|nr:type II toxin-antitoxin system VapC family toxin [Chloroflexota bacterium]
MERISERLASNDLIGLDTSIFIYHFESNPKYIQITNEILTCIESGETQAITSVLTIMELSVRPWQLGKGHIARKYEALLSHFPNLQIIDIDREIGRWAARLRAEFNLSPPDALHLATCITNGASAFISNDRLLKRVNGILEIFILDDFLSP